VTAADELLALGGTATGGDGSLELDYARYRADLLNTEFERAREAVSETLLEQQGQQMDSDAANAANGGGGVFGNGKTAAAGKGTGSVSNDSLSIEVDVEAMLERRRQRDISRFQLHGASMELQQQQERANDAAQQQK